ncbi:hypothetical protein [Henriciella sp.]|uniref:hypothetical protein n=1 Tax=Henriciella sp. TaxID=1968823 RepID=UPI002638912B|nr:hypothetical protein [Henriciella sp.]
MHKTMTIVSGAVLLAGAASAQIVELPETFNRFDISGVKLGDSPDTVIAALRERGYECDFSLMVNADGTLINSNGNAGSMVCKTTAQVEQRSGRAYPRAEVVVDFGNRDLSGTGTDASKVFATLIEFKENYPDKPSVDTIDARLRGKYGELDYHDYYQKWSKSGASAPDLEERKSAYKAKERECDSIPRSERIAKLECSLAEAELQYDYLAGRPADLEARYFSADPDDSYSKIRITANWSHWGAVMTRRSIAAGTERSLDEERAEPEIDEDVETTF